MGRCRRSRRRGWLTTRNAPMTAWKPSPLMVRILSGAVILAAVIGLVFAGLYGVYALVLILGGLALWGFRGHAEGMGSRAPAWLLFPLGAFFAFSGTVLKGVDVTLVLALTLVGGLAAFLFVPGRRQGLGRWAMGVAGALYIAMPFNFYLLLYTSKPNGLVWTLFTNFAVLGATGSIGRQTLDVIDRNPARFKLFGLTEGVRSTNREAPYFVHGQAGETEFDTKVEAMVTDPRCDLVVVAIPGARALSPTMSALRAGKEVALATKEVLVMAGALVMKLAGEKGIRPVDSEHSAIWQCLWGEERANVRRLIVTASAGR